VLKVQRQTSQWADSWKGGGVSMALPLQLPAAADLVPSSPASLRRSTVEATRRTDARCVEELRARPGREGQVEVSRAPLSDVVAASTSRCGRRRPRIPCGIERLSALVRFTAYYSCCDL